MIVGFTGTRDGMSFAQSESLLRVLRGLCPTEVHHGCCVGADAQLHNLAYWDWPLYGHPGPPGPLRMQISGVVDEPGFRFARNINGFCFLYPAKDYGARNQDIVRVCHVLVAAPAEMVEARGGTWQTVRRARKARRKIVVVWPDGSTS